MNRTLAIAIAITVSAALGAGAALYWKYAGHGNVGTAGPQTAAAACQDAAARATRLADLATGDVAAFTLAKKPANLSGLAFRDEQDAAITLTDFSGRVSLVNLWATWCAPCRREMPALDRLQQQLGGARFGVVTINIDIGDWSRPAAFLQSVGVTALPGYRDPDNTSFQELKRRGLALGLPATALVDGSGCLVGHLQGPAEWDSPDAIRLIEAVLDEQSAGAAGSG